MNDAIDDMYTSPPWEQKDLFNLIVCTWERDLP